MDIGQFSANKWGFFDMHGNVWEWTADRYQAAYPTGNPVIDPIGPASGWNRVRRGIPWLGKRRGGLAFRQAQGIVTPERTLHQRRFPTRLRQTSPPPPITNANFTTAINLWFSDEANATRIYGHIRDWNVTGVTNMSNAFKDRTTFNEDISGWGSPLIFGDTNTSKFYDMSSMFKNATLFNQKLGQLECLCRSKDAKPCSMELRISIKPIGNLGTFLPSPTQCICFQRQPPLINPSATWNTVSSTNMGSMFKGPLPSINQDLVIGTFLPQ